MKATVSKLSKSGKTMLVKCKSDKYEIGLKFGWCANPDGLKKGDDVLDFNPKGTAQIYDEDGKPLTYANGEPLLKWVF